MMSNRIGDFFDEGVKNKFPEKIIKCGDVFYIWYEHAKPEAKTKLFLVYGCDEVKESLATLIFNTNLNFFVKNLQHLQDAQYPIMKRDFNFFDNDCFVDCTEFITFPYKDIENYFKSKKNPVIGNIYEVDNHFSNIQLAVSKSKVMDTYTKKLYKPENL